MNAKEKKKVIAQRIADAEKAKKRLDKEAAKVGPRRMLLNHRRKEINDWATPLLKV